MGFFGDFVGGAADAGAGIIGNQIALQQKTAEAQKLAQLNADLELEKAKTIASYTHQLNQQPLNDFAAAAASHQNDQVPTDPPAPVTSTSGIADRSSMVGADGQPIQSAGPGDVGLSGNIAALRAQIMNTQGMSDQDRSGALAQLDAQATQQNQANAANAPATRTMTRDEAIDAGLNDLLKSGNGAAYAAGKPLAIDKTLAVPDGGAVIDQKTGRVLFQNSGKADRQMVHDDNQATLLQTRLDAAEKLKRLELDPLGINGATTGDGAGSGSVSKAIANGATGKDLLDSLKPVQAEMVKALAEGRMAFPSGAALRSPQWQGILSLVGQYDPSFDAVNYGARAATRKDFTSGKASQNVNALNTVLGHLDTLGTAADELNNTSVPLWNSLANSVQSGMGDSRVKKFEATKKAVVDELTRAWRGSGGSEGDIKSWSSTLDAANSPDQLHGVIGQIGDLLESKINAMNDQYTKGMGTAAGGLNLMSPNAQKVLQRIKQRAGMDTSAQQSGGVLTYDPSTGSFK
jgi:hypothetical protein